ncbi:MAG: hypothetical protein JXR37_36485 [Kiritimatiellae bacterium]|nr:hypothetical protein [Kiritimatiellia bacterium]
MIRTVSELRPGQEVLRDVEARGMVLLKKGTVLTEAHIARLKKWDIGRIDVASTGTEPDAAAETANPAAGQPDQTGSKRVQRLETAFAPYGGDEQMQLLKTSLLQHLQARNGHER